MGTRAVESGAGRWKAVQVGGGVAVLAGVLFALPNLHRPPPPSTALHRADIHSEYVKFPSGRDTITAYLAYPDRSRSEEHTSELQSQSNLVCRLLLEKKKTNTATTHPHL